MLCFTLRNICVFLFLIFFLSKEVLAENIIDKTDYTNIDNIFKQYNNAKNNINKTDDKNIYIFISFSMTDNILQNYIIEAQNIKQKYNIDIVFVLRGFYKNSFKETQIKINSLLQKLDNKNIGIIVDPRLFKEYHITQVPVILKINDKNDYDKISGTVTLEYAINKFGGKIE